MNNFQDHGVLFNNTVCPLLFLIVGILFICGTHKHDSIISLKGKVCAHQASLTPPLFIEVPVPSQEIKWSRICVLARSMHACVFWWRYKRVNSDGQSPIYIKHVTALNIKNTTTYIYISAFIL